LADDLMLASGNTLLRRNQGIFSDAVYYLQRQGDTTTSGTLQTLPVSVQPGSAPCQVYGFAASPNPIIAATGSGSTMVSGVANCLFEIRQGRPQGTLVATSILAPTYNYVASAITASTVTNGTQFFMAPPQLGRTAQNSLAAITVNVLKSESACEVVQFSANPQRILSTNGLGATTIMVLAGCAFDIRIGGPSGVRFASGSGYLAAQTGQWVNNGMTFYLQRAGDTTAAGTLQTETVLLLSGNHSVAGHR
jgi:hypothetical protein